MSEVSRLPGGRAVIADAKIENRAQMPYLSWSAAALAGVKNKDAKAETARLFHAYFRVADEKALRGTRVCLDLPGSNKDCRYYFYAEFHPKFGWTVNSELKREHREVRFERRIPPVCML